MRLPNPDIAPLVSVEPLRAEVRSAGAVELATARDVDEALREEGHLLLYVDSVCGCAATIARPALQLFTLCTKRPVRIAALLAAVDHDALARLRHVRPQLPASTPQIVLLRDGDVQRTWGRREMMRIGPSTLAQVMQDALDLPEPRKPWTSRLLPFA